MATEDRCECGSNNIVRWHNAGWDCFPSCEETQHLDTCLDCGRTRIVCDWISFESGERDSGTSYGKWSRTARGVGPCSSQGLLLLGVPGLEGLVEAERTEPEERVNQDAW